MATFIDMCLVGNRLGFPVVIPFLKLRPIYLRFTLRAQYPVSQQRVPIAVEYTGLPSPGDDREDLLLKRPIVVRMLGQKEGSVHAVNAYHRDRRETVLIDDMPEPAQVDRVHM